MPTTRSSTSVTPGELRKDGGYGNAMLILINALAHRFTGRDVYRHEAAGLRDRAQWLAGSTVTEIRYYGQCLSSEMLASFLAAYWRGRRDGLW